MCVQRLDDSLNSAIHISYRISLRSSSMPEPRDPLLKVLTNLASFSDCKLQTAFKGGLRRARARGQEPPGGREAVPPKQQRFVKHGWEVGPRGALTQ